MFSKGVEAWRGVVARGELVIFPAHGMNDSSRRGILSAKKGGVGKKENGVSSAPTAPGANRGKEQAVQSRNHRRPFLRRDSPHDAPPRRPCRLTRRESHQQLHHRETMNHKKEVTRAHSRHGGEYPQGMCSHTFPSIRSAASAARSGQG